MWICVLKSKNLQIYSKNVSQVTICAAQALNTFGAPFPICIFDKATITECMFSFYIFYPLQTSCLLCHAARNVCAMLFCPTDSRHSLCTLQTLNHTLYTYSTLNSTHSSTLQTLNHMLYTYSKLNSTHSSTLQILNHMLYTLYTQ